MDFVQKPKAGHFRVITVNEAEDGVIEIPLSDPTEQSRALDYWARLVALRDVTDNAEESLVNDNQQLAPEQVRLWHERLETAASTFREFRPVDLVDADGRVRVLNTDVNQALEHYRIWLTENDRPI